MRFGLERMHALLERARPPGAGRAGPPRRGHQRQVVHRAGSPPPRWPARGGAWGPTCRRTSPTGPSASRWPAGRSARPAFAAAAGAVRDAAEALRAARRRRGDPVRGPHGDRPSGRFRDGRASAPSWSRPASAAATTPPTSCQPRRRRRAHQRRPRAHRVARRHRGGDRRREARRLRRRLGPARGGAAQSAAGAARGGRGVRPPRPAAAALRRGPRRAPATRRTGWRSTTPRAVYAGPAPRAARAPSSATTSPSPSRGPRWCWAARSIPPAAARGRGRGARCPAGWRCSPARPPCVLDGAHNPAGMEAMVASLPEVLAGRRPVVAVVSVLGDKDAGAMVAALARRWSTGSSPRARATRAPCPPEELAAIARAAAGIPRAAVGDPAAALAAARAAGGPGRRRPGRRIPVPSGRSAAHAWSQGLQEPPARLARARKGTDPTEAK